MVKAKQEGEWEIVHGNKWTPIIGDSIQGVYLKTIPARKQDESNQYIIESDGKELIVFGTTDLDSKFKEVPIGWEVMITFIEEKQMKPPKNPFKVFEVKKRRLQTDTVSGAAGDDQEPEKPTPSMNTKDVGEIRSIVDGIENDLKDHYMDVIELNMFTVAKEQCGDDKEYLELVKEEIRARKYPAKIKEGKK